MIFNLQVKLCYALNNLFTNNTTSNINNIHDVYNNSFFENLTFEVNNIYILLIVKIALYIFSLIIVKLFAIIGILYIFFIILVIFSFFSDVFVNNICNLIDILFSDIEEDLSDNISPLFIFILFLTFIQFEFIYFFNFDSFYLTLLSLIFVLFAVITSPFLYLLDYGFFFIIFIRGATIKKSAIFETINDYIHLFSFFLRMYIQLIRFLIIIISIVMFDDIFYNSNYINIEPLHYTEINFTIIDIILYYINFFIYSINYFLIETIHFISTTYNQLSAYILVIAFLIQFLYTSYLNNEIEQFLYSLRYKK